MIKILICDDQDIVCEGLQRILQVDAEINVVGIAHDGMQALQLIPEKQPDLVLMDLKMPGMNGIAATRKIRQQYPDVFVLVLTTYDDDEWIFDAIRSGASGYLLKDTPREGLIEAIKGTIAGDAYVDPGITRKLLKNIATTLPKPRTPTTHLFSERESEVLQLLARGLTNADIAGQLFLSEGTIRNYTSSIFARLGVADRTQAAIAALRYGLVDMNEL